MPLLEAQSPGTVGDGKPSLFWPASVMPSDWEMSGGSRTCASLAVEVNFSFLSVWVLFVGHETQLLLDIIF